MFNVWFWASSNWYVMAITIFVVQSMQNCGTFMKSLKVSQGLWQRLLLGTVRGTNFLPVFYNKKTVSRLIGPPPRFYILPIVGCHSLFWVKETCFFFFSNLQVLLHSRHDLLRDHSSWTLLGLLLISLIWQPPPSAAQKKIVQLQVILPKTHLNYLVTHAFYWKQSEVWVTWAFTLKST